MVQFHSDCHLIPGIHTPFSTRGLLERYLTHHSTTNKDPLSGILCKLKKLGNEMRLHSLHLALGFSDHHSNINVYKTQKPSYVKLAEKRDATVSEVNEDLVTGNFAITLKLAEKRDATVSEVNEDLATGNFAITLLISGFDVRSLRTPLHASTYFIPYTKSLLPYMSCRTEDACDSRSFTTRTYSAKTSISPHKTTHTFYAPRGTRIKNLTDPTT